MFTNAGSTLVSCPATMRTRRRHTSAPGEVRSTTCVPGSISMRSFGSTSQPFVGLSSLVPSSVTPVCVVSASSSTSTSVTIPTGASISTCADFQPRLSTSTSSLPAVIGRGAIGVPP